MGLTFWGPYTRCGGTVVEILLPPERDPGPVFLPGTAKVFWPPDAVLSRASCFKVPTTIWKVPCPTQRGFIRSPVPGGRRVYTPDVTGTLPDGRKTETLVSRREGS